MAASLETLASRIKDAHKRSQEAVRTSLTIAREIGDALLAAKQIVKGQKAEWIPWVTQHCHVSLAESQRYMRIAARWDELIASGRDLTEIGLVQALKSVSKQKPREQKTPEVFIVSSESELEDQRSNAELVVFSSESTASSFVAKHASRLGAQVMRLAQRKELTDEHGKHLSPSLAALAIVRHLQKALESSLAIRVGGAVTASSESLKPPKRRGSKQAVNRLSGNASAATT
jgi:hypothetical protein